MIYSDNSKSEKLDFLLRLGRMNEEELYDQLNARFHNPEIYLLACGEIQRRANLNLTSLK